MQHQQFALTVQAVQAGQGRVQRQQAVQRQRRAAELAQRAPRIGKRRVADGGHCGQAVQPTPQDHQHQAWAAGHSRTGQGQAGERPQQA